MFDPRQTGVVVDCVCERRAEEEEVGYESTGMREKVPIAPISLCTTTFSLSEPYPNFQCQLL